MNRLLLIFLSCFLGSNLYAGHSIGGYITYKHLGSLKYEVTFTIYRDCRGIPLSSGSVNAEMLGDGTAKAKLSLTLVTINDVSGFCKSYGKPCNPANQTISNSNPSIEEHIFKDTVDFNGNESAFKKYCSIKFGAGLCCRSGAITTGPANGDFWVWSELNICKAPNNSSTLITALPNNVLCCNQAYYSNFGAIDSIDRDSLSFEFTDPMQDWKTKITYNSGFSYNSPISVYYPTGYNKAKGPNPSANPPIGIYFDPETGELIFTPIDCSEYTVICIKITEWRKDSTGTYQNIGEVRRDLNYFVMSCPGNNPPKLNGPFKYSTCANTQICFDVTSDDKQYIPPPPAKASPPDTVTLTWNFGIQRGATFTIVNSQARLQTGKFCWTPKDSDASTIPYTFNVTANDNSCPVASITSKTYSVIVKKIAKTKVSVKALAPNIYEITNTINSDFIGSPSFSTHVIDSAMQSVDGNYAFNIGNGPRFYTSGVRRDTIQFRKAGKYYLHHFINNPPLNCGSEYFDTIFVSAAIDLKLIGNDTILCPGNKMTYKAYADGGKKPYTYQWNNLKPDTNTVFTIRATRDTAINLIVKDANGLNISEKRILRVRTSNIDVDAGPDKLVCKNDSFVLTAKPLNVIDSARFVWEYEGKVVSNQSQLKSNIIGTYVIKIYDRDYCFSNVDTVQVRDTSMETFAGKDEAICKGNSVTLRAKDPSNTGKQVFDWYKFSFGQSDSFISKSDSITVRPLNTTTYLIKQTNTLGKLTCTATDTVSVIVKPLPVVKLIKSKTVCQNENEVDLTKLVVLPTDYSTGIPTWSLRRTLPKPGGGSNKFADLVINKGTGSTYLYVAKVDENTIKVPGGFSDSIRLALRFKSDLGCECINSDSVTIIIKTNVTVNLGQPYNKVCSGDSLKKLSDTYNVNYYGGKWYTENDSTSYASWPQGDNKIVGETVASSGLNNVTKPYLLKYEIENNGCLSTGFGKLQVIPYPVIKWSQKIVGDSVTLTDNSTNGNERSWFLNNSFYSASKSIILTKFIAGSKTILLKSANGSCITDSIIVPSIPESIGLIDKLGLKVYPNPFSNNLHISIKETGSYSGEIINSIGQTVLRFTGQSPETELQLDTLPAGVYHILINVNGHILQTGITKQRQ